MTTIKAIITTLDNLSTLKEQVNILKDDDLINEIVVVNNGSIDSTQIWLDGQESLTVVHNKENRGASVGRNSGLDAAGYADYFLMLDGGIRPLRGGVRRMLDYLERRQDADVLGLEIADLETDHDLAWRRWVNPITDEMTYQNTRLSHTAYCLARFRAFDGIRFCEEGPFGEKGHAAEDDELAYQWNDAGIVIHVVTGLHPYRHAGGSHARLFKETGVYPHQYGSVYEKRCVWLQQNWPQYEPILQWGEPYLTVVVKVGDVDATAKIIKHAHDLLLKRRFEKPWSHIPNPYSIIAWGNSPEWKDWAQWRHLRQHHGNVTIVDGEIVRRGSKNEAAWTGDFRMWDGDDWRGAIRPNAYYYGLVENTEQLEALMARYNEVHPRQPVKCPPDGKGEL
jgi:glycosyltransferase involved in cell wall biosynthesis